MSHHLEELTLRHLYKQYLQTNHCSSVHIERFGPNSLKSSTFGKIFLKEKKIVKGKIGANSIYDHHCSIQKDPLVPLKLEFFEDIAKTLNSFVVPYQTNKPLVPFLAESLERLLRLLCAKFIREDVLESAKTAIY